jgi:hypothetical protein
MMEPEIKPKKFGIYSNDFVERKENLDINNLYLFWIGPRAGPILLLADKTSFASYEFCSAASELPCSESLRCHTYHMLLFTRARSG